VAASRLVWVKLEENQGECWIKFPYCREGSRLYTKVWTSGWLSSHSTRRKGMQVFFCVTSFACIVSYSQSGSPHFWSSTLYLSLSYNIIIIVCNTVATQNRYFIALSYFQFQSLTCWKSHGSSQNSWYKYFYSEPLVVHHASSHAFILLYIHFSTMVSFIPRLQKDVSTLPWF